MSADDEAEVTYAYRGNGATMPVDEQDTWASVRKWVAPWMVLNACASLLIFLIATGWLMVPASSGDLEKTRSQLTEVAAKVDKLDASMAKMLERIEASIGRLQLGQQQSREEIIRLGAAFTSPAMASAEPSPTPQVVHKPKPKKRPPPAVKQAEQPGFFQKLVQ